MDDQTDSQLLRAYAGHRSEPAFAELVRRHVDFVYSAALRMVCDSHLAQDVTQGVFVALAKNAAQLTDHPVLSGWLHRTAQNIAAQTVRTDVRRRAREQEAAAMNELLSAEPDANWEHIAPHLDAALGELSEPDRDALLLRYFERKSAREMAQTLGISDEAAQKRVNRAVERLREFFAKRGVTVGAGGLVVISANAVQAAPVGLAVAISTAAAIAGTTIATTSTATAIKTIAMTTLQKTIVTAALAATVGAGIYEAHKAAQLREQNQTLQQQQAPLAEQIQQLQRERDEAKNQLTSVREEKARLTNNNTELLRLRGMAGVARRAIGETEQLRTQLARQASAASNNPVTGAMSDAMKQAMEQQVEGRLSRMAASLHLTPEQTQAIHDILMKQAQLMSAGMQQAFSGNFNKEELAKLAKEGGDPEAQIKALLTPEQQAAYPACQREEAGHNASLAANSELLQLQTTLGLTPDQLDRVYAALYDLNFSQLNGSLKPSSANMADTMQWVLDHKAEALEPVLTPTQLEKYRQQLATQAKLQKDILIKMEGAGTLK
jgi:RNA polymerase sigma factor (sigma-70 family)